MDEFISIKVLELVKSYGLQVLGVLIVIFFIKGLFILLIQAVLVIVGTVLFLLGFILKIIRSILNRTSGDLRNKVDKILVTIEARDRKLESRWKFCYGSVKKIPAHYDKFQNRYIKVVKGALVTGLILIAVLLIFDIVIQKRYSIEQLFLHFL